MHSGNMVSEISDFVFYGVDWKEIDGCIGGDWFSEYVNFEARWFSDYKYVKEANATVVFLCRIELYVCVFSIIYTNFYIYRIVLPDDEQ